jgi:hypothetical protein
MYGNRLPHVIKLTEITKLKPKINIRTKLKLLKNKIINEKPEPNN